MTTDIQTTAKTEEQTALPGATDADLDVASWRAPPSKKDYGSLALVLWGITPDEFERVRDGGLTLDDARELAHDRVRRWRVTQ